MSATHELRRPPLIPFNDHARIEMIGVSAGNARTRIGDHHELTNHLGTVHGGALFTVGEAASGHAFMGALYAAIGQRIGTMMAVVKSAHISFLKPAKGTVEANATLATPMDELLATMEREGRATATVNVSLTNSEGVKVAELSTEWHVRPRR
jgi:acyl-coenzyme A thioesterase PaaI-like protein